MLFRSRKAMASSMFSRLSSTSESTFVSHTPRSSSPVGGVSHWTVVGESVDSGKEVDDRQPPAISATIDRTTPTRYKTFVPSLSLPWSCRKDVANRSVLSAGPVMHSKWRYGWTGRKSSRRGRDSSPKVIGPCRDMVHEPVCWTEARTDLSPTRSLVTMQRIRPPQFFCSELGDLQCNFVSPTQISSRRKRNVEAIPNLCSRRGGDCTRRSDRP